MATDGGLPDSSLIKKRKRDNMEDGHSSRPEKRSRSKKSRRKPKHEQVNGQENIEIAVAETGIPRPKSKHDQTNGQQNLESTTAEAGGPPGRAIVSEWKVSNPMGGRMLGIDPIYSPDEKHLILTFNASIQVYSTTDSLLIRRIAIPIMELDDMDGPREPHIVASSLSKVSSGFVWIACSDGRVWRIDWTSGSGADRCFHTQNRTLLDLTVDSIQFAKKSRDLLITSEKKGTKSRHLVAYDLDALTKKTGIILHTDRDGILCLRSANEARVIVGATKNGVVLGMLNPDKRLLGSLKDLKYQFFSFEPSDRICCLDLRLSSTKKRQSDGKHHQSLDLVVGCVRGTILLYQDVLSSFQVGQRKTTQERRLQPRLYHWHRRAVHSVKWSRDGNYLISGGSEQVLVLWQLDTGKHDTLPHLTGTIENIVVSPRGSSYALHLDDNSAMIISTAELKPVTYISGFQSAVADNILSKNALVRRVGQEAEPILPLLVGTTSPTDPSRLLLCVGNGQQATLASGIPSTPLLQVFDLDSFRSVAKYSIARTNPADINTTAKGYPIHEPHVTHMAVSNDGLWLASVDEWQPPNRDFETFVDGYSDAADLARQRREIFLKFWEIGEDMAPQLVSRINEAHFTDKTESIFDLAADRTSTRFATVGGDGAVRFWASIPRQRDGLHATSDNGQPLRTWRCTRVVSVGDSPKFQYQMTMAPSISPIETQRSGSLVFSEDGSTLFVAYGGSDDAVVYVIDTETGEVRNILREMFTGRVRDIKTISSYLIILSDDLRVYDVVADQLCYGLHLRSMPEDIAHLTQLAVDNRSKSFAVVCPCPGQYRQGTNNVIASELAVFSTTKSEPRLIETFPRAITCLLPGPSSAGFVAIDSAAQAWTIQQGTESGSFARPLADIHLADDSALEGSAEQTPAVLLDGENEDPVDDEMQDVSDDGEDEDEDYNVHSAIIAPQRLAEIFDTAPAFALPPIEELFYRVTGLISKRPASAAPT